MGTGWREQSDSKLLLLGNFNTRNELNDMEMLTNSFPGLLIKEIAEKFQRLHVSDLGVKCL